MKRRKVRLIYTALILIISLIGCGSKPDYSLPKQEIVLPEESGLETEEIEDDKEEFDSKNASEYARLERILQELKRQTDDSE